MTLIILLISLLVTLSIAGLIWLFNFRKITAASTLKVMTQRLKDRNTLILDIEKEANNFGYADPLAQVILSKIRELRQKENK